jgi:hypothetical protein
MFNPIRSIILAGYPFDVEGTENMAFLDQITASKRHVFEVSLGAMPYGTYWLEVALAAALIVLGAGAAGLLGSA